MVKAVLFDFDGTLLNTNDLIFNAYRYTFKNVLGRDITDEEIHSLYGRPLYESLAVYGDAQDELYRQYRFFSDKYHNEYVKEFPNNKEGVLAFKDKGIKLGIVTSKREESLKRGLEFLDLLDKFDILITPKDTKKHKPDPEPILAACEKLLISPKECIYLGDSIFDFECALSAGCIAAGVNYSTTLDAILKYKPTYMVDSVMDLFNQMFQ